MKPEEKKQYTRQEKARNWWHYHRWALLIGLLLLIAAADLLLGALGVGQEKPDYQVAVAASAPLKKESLEALESVFAAAGVDCTGNGRVSVRLNSYVDMAASGETDTARYAAAAQVRLMADMESCDSYFFLCGDPEKLQSDYQILARADGALAGPGEEASLYALGDLPVFRAAVGDHPELAGLYLARRGFWADRSCAFRSECDALWETLTKEEIP